MLRWKNVRVKLDLNQPLAACQVGALTTLYLYEVKGRPRVPSIIFTQSANTIGDWLKMIYRTPRLPFTSERYKAMPSPLAVPLPPVLISRQYSNNFWSDSIK